MGDCVEKTRICVIRGDGFDYSVGLSSVESEIAADPTAWGANLVFREAQDDNLTPYLTLTGVFEAVPPAAMPAVPKSTTPVVYVAFTATAAETQALPEWDHVAYCEVVELAASPQVPRRLFNATAFIND